MKKITFYCIKFEEASDALYNSSWYDLSTISERKMFLTLLGQSQMKNGFSAYGLIDMSYATYNQVHSQISINEPLILVRYLFPHTQALIRSIYIFKPSRDN